MMLSFTFCFLCVAAVIVQNSAEKRISRTKCEEYQHLIKNKNICNVQVPSVPYADSGNFPFIGLIGFQDENEILWLCSGSLISEQYVLTTGHCAVHRDYGWAKYVRFGETDLTVSNNNAKTFNVSKIIKHPLLKAPSYYYDVALLKLEEPIEFTEFIRPICLYTGEDLSKYHMTGFSFRTKELEIRKGILLHQNVETESKEVCKQEFAPNRKLKEGVNFTIQFCIKDAEYACELNSGAAIIHKDEELDCMYNIAGISGVGRGVCLKRPELEVKVSSVADWIELTVWP